MLVDIVALQRFRSAGTGQKAESLETNYPDRSRNSHAVACAICFECLEESRLISPKSTAQTARKDPRGWEHPQRTTLS